MASRTVLDRIQDTLERHRELIEESTQLSLSTAQRQREVTSPTLEEIAGQVKTLNEDHLKQKVLIRAGGILWGIFMALLAAYVSVRQAGWLK